MKKYFIPFLLSIGFPLSVSATNYVECEAIRAVITRTEIQIEDVKKKSPHNFAEFKVNQKYPENNFIKYGSTGFCYGLYGKSNYDECYSYLKTIARFINNVDTEIQDEYKSEFREFTLSKLKPYVKVSERATNDFKKRGCYYF